MNMKKLSVIVASVLLILRCSHQSDFEYFGQKPPGNTPVIFAPSIISLDDRNESMITFSPNGRKCYFTVSEIPWQDVRILETVYQDTGWTKPAKAPFINSFGFCPSISADGKKLFFIGSYRGTSAGVNQCLLTANGEWSAPVEMDSLVNSGSNEYSVHPSNLGNMYVCSWRSGGVGGCDGWRIPYANGKYQKAENLGVINSVVGDCVWAPGPDEKFLIFQSRRPASGNRGGFFETDLFITFAMPNGKWSHPQNLGPQINSPATDGMAWVSHDGKYLFFSSDRNGTYDIYWVSLDSVLTNTPKIPLVAVNHFFYLFIFERIKAPLFLVSDRHDRTWPSSEFCETIIRRLKEKTFRYEVIHICGENAGHQVYWPSYIPGNEPGIVGGNPRDKVKWSLIAWNEMLSFLHNYLDATSRN